MKKFLVVVMMMFAVPAFAGDRFENGITERVLTEVVVGTVLNGVMNREVIGVGVNTGNPVVDQVLNRNVVLKTNTRMLNGGGKCFTKMIYRGNRMEPAMICN
jgi:hypothetical protein